MLAVSVKSQGWTEAVFIGTFLLMLGSVTGAGILLLMGIFDTTLAPLFTTLGVVFMIAFFVFFGMFIYSILGSMKPEYKRHLI